MSTFVCLINEQISYGEILQGSSFGARGLKSHPLPQSKSTVINFKIQVLKFFVQDPRSSSISAPLAVSFWEVPVPPPALFFLVF